LKRLYENGTVLTMDDAAPFAESLVEENGKILAVGTAADLRSAYPQAERHDLQGGVMMPAFLDAHSHFSAVASGMLQVSLKGCGDFSAVRKKIETAVRDGTVRKGEWLQVKDYDQNNLRERCRLDAALLDAVAPENPVMVQHQCGHTGVCNSAAMRLLGITQNTPDPVGGRYGRNADGTPNGYLEENAFFANIRKVPLPDGRALLGAYDRAQKKYASYGISTVQEGMMVSQSVPMHRLLLESGALRLDLVSYPEFPAAEELYSAFSEYSRGYRQHYRLGGIKIFLDGSPQERTAWMRPQSAYLPQKPGGKRDTGSGVLDEKAVERAVVWAAQHGVQLLAHCNGDAAAQQYLMAVEAAERQFPHLAELRPVMIHAQLLAPDQLMRVHACGVVPSFFVAHVYHWGDLHIQNFGLARASKISPAADALRAGIRFTFHQDSPVIAPDMLETVWCARNRVTKAGVLLGAEERISVWEALKAITVNAAWQYGELRTKGSLVPGKNADFVLLDRNPMAVLPEDIRHIKILRTVKDGETIFESGC
jgi:predicted amidohydrolase YtcJ